MKVDQMYWRGGVLNESNGFIWKNSMSKKSNTNFNVSKEDIINYTIMLDPLNLNNVFVLDVPLKITSSSLPIQQHQHQL